MPRQLGGAEAAGARLLQRVCRLAALVAVVAAWTAGSQCVPTGTPPSVVVGPCTTGSALSLQLDALFPSAASAVSLVVDRVTLTGAAAAGVLDIVGFASAPAFSGSVVSVVSSSGRILRLTGHFPAGAAIAVSASTFTGGSFGGCSGACFAHSACFDVAAFGVGTTLDVADSSFTTASAATSSALCFTATPIVLRGTSRIALLRNAYAITGTTATNAAFVRLLGTLRLTLAGSFTLSSAGLSVHAATVASTAQFRSVLFAAACTVADDGVLTIANFRLQLTLSSGTLSYAGLVRFDAGLALTNRGAAVLSQLRLTHTTGASLGTVLLVDFTPTLSIASGASLRLSNCALEVTSSSGLQDLRTLLRSTATGLSDSGTLHVVSNAFFTGSAATSAVVASHGMLLALTAVANSVVVIESTAMVVSLLSTTLVHTVVCVSLLAASPTPVLSASTISIVDSSITVVGSSTSVNVRVVHLTALTLDSASTLTVLRASLTFATPLTTNSVIGIHFAGALNALAGSSVVLADSQMLVTTTSAPVMALVRFGSDVTLSESTMTLRGSIVRLSTTIHSSELVAGLFAFIAGLTVTHAGATAAALEVADNVASVLVTSHVGSLIGSALFQGSTQLRGSAAGGPALITFSGNNLTHEWLVPPTVTFGAIRFANLLAVEGSFASTSDNVTIAQTATSVATATLCGVHLVAADLNNPLTSAVGMAWAALRLTSSAVAVNTALFGVLASSLSLTSTAFRLTAGSVVSVSGSASCGGVNLAMTRAVSSSLVFLDVRIAATSALANAMGLSMSSVTFRSSSLVSIASLAVTVSAGATAAGINIGFGLTASALSLVSSSVTVGAVTSAFCLLFPQATPTFTLGSSVFFSAVDFRVSTALTGIGISTQSPTLVAASTWVITDSSLAVAGFVSCVGLSFGSLRITASSWRLDATQVTLLHEFSDANRPVAMLGIRFTTSLVLVDGSSFAVTHSQMTLTSALTLSLSTPPVAAAISLIALTATGAGTQSLEVASVSATVSCDFCASGHFMFSSGINSLTTGGITVRSCAVNVSAGLALAGDVSSNGAGFLVFASLIFNSVGSTANPVTLDSNTASIRSSAAVAGFVILAGNVVVLSNSLIVTRCSVTLVTAQLANGVDTSTAGISLATLTFTGAGARLRVADNTWRISASGTSVAVFAVLALGSLTSTFAGARIDVLRNSGALDMPSNALGSAQFTGAFILGMTAAFKAQCQVAVEANAVVVAAALTPTVFGLSFGLTSSSTNPMDGGSLAVRGNTFQLGCDGVAHGIFLKTRSPAIPLLFEATTNVVSIQGPLTASGVTFDTTTAEVVAWTAGNAISVAGNELRIATTRDDAALTGVAIIANDTVSCAGGAVVDVSRNVIALEAQSATKANITGIRLTALQLSATSPAAIGVSGNTLTLQGPGIVEAVVLRCQAVTLEGGATLNVSSNTAVIKISAPAANSPAIAIQGTLAVQRSSMAVFASNALSIESSSAAVFAGTLLSIAALRVHFNSFVGVYRGSIATIASGAVSARDAIVLGETSVVSRSELIVTGCDFALVDGGQLVRLASTSILGSSGLYVVGNTVTASSPSLLFGDSAASSIALASDGFLAISETRWLSSGAPSATLLFAAAALLSVGNSGRFSLGCNYVDGAPIVDYALHMTPADFAVITDIVACGECAPSVSCFAPNAEAALGGQSTCACQCLGAPTSPLSWAPCAPPYTPHTWTHTASTSHMPTESRTPSLSSAPTSSPSLTHSPPSETRTAVDSPSATSERSASVTRTDSESLSAHHTDDATASASGTESLPEASPTRARTESRSISAPRSATASLLATPTPTSTLPVTPSPGTLSDSQSSASTLSDTASGPSPSLVQSATPTPTESRSPSAPPSSSLSAASSASATASDSATQQLSQSGPSLTPSSTATAALASATESHSASASLSASGSGPLASATASDSLFASSSPARTRSQSGSPSDSSSPSPSGEFSQSPRTHSPSASISRASGSQQLSATASGTASSSPTPAASATLSATHSQRTRSLVASASRSLEASASASRSAQPTPTDSVTPSRASPTRSATASPSPPTPSHSSSLPESASDSASRSDSNTAPTAHATPTATHTRPTRSPSTPRSESVSEATASLAPSESASLTHSGSSTRGTGSRSATHSESHPSPSPTAARSASRSRSPSVEASPSVESASPSPTGSASPPSRTPSESPSPSATESATFTPSRSASRATKSRVASLSAASLTPSATASLSNAAATATASRSASAEGGTASPSPSHRRTATILLSPSRSRSGRSDTIRASPTAPTLSETPSSTSSGGGATASRPNATATPSSDATLSGTESRTRASRSRSPTDPRSASLTRQPSSERSASPTYSRTRSLSVATRTAAASRSATLEHTRTRSRRPTHSETVSPSKSGSRSRSNPSRTQSGRSPSEANTFSISRQPTPTASNSLSAQQSSTRTVAESLSLPDAPSRADVSLTRTLNHTQSAAIAVERRHGAFDDFVDVVALNRSECFRVVVLALPLLLVLLLVHLIRYLIRRTVAPLADPASLDDVAAWRGLAALHVYAGALLPCHYRCGPLHGLELLAHVLTLLALLAAFTAAFAPRFWSLRVVLCLVVPVVAAAVRAATSRLLWRYSVAARTWQRPAAPVGSPRVVQQPRADALTLPRAAASPSRSGRRHSSVVFTDIAPAESQAAARPAPLPPLPPMDAAMLALFDADIDVQEVQELPLAPVAWRNAPLFDAIAPDFELPEDQVVPAARPDDDRDLAALGFVAPETPGLAPAEAERQRRALAPAPLALSSFDLDAEIAVPSFDFDTDDDDGEDQPVKPATAFLFRDLDAEALFVDRKPESECEGPRETVFVRRTQHGPTVLVLVAIAAVAFLACFFLSALLHEWNLCGEFSAMTAIVVVAFDLAVVQSLFVAIALAARSVTGSGATADSLWQLHPFHGHHFQLIERGSEGE